MRHFLLSFLLFLLALSMLPATTAAADKTARFREFTATTSKANLIVFASLENSFTTEMLETLHSGVPLRFVYYLELYKTTKDWPDELLTAISFQHIMQFDTLKEGYRVTLEEENNKELSFKSLFKAQKAINEVSGAPVIDLQQLVPERIYKLRIRAELYQKTLPLDLHSLFPFLSWWDVETDWYTIEFKY